MIHLWIRGAWRNLIRYRTFSVLNIAGLSLGICCVISVFLYVTDDLKFDHFHEKADRIYRVNTISRFNAIENRYSTTSTPLAEAIQPDVPEVERVARLFNREATLQVLSDDGGVVDTKKFKEVHFYFADPSILKILTFSFLKGNPATALSIPQQAIVTRKIAEKYFGSVDEAVGKLLKLEGAIPLVVAAVIENYPEQSHLRIDVISHFENYFNVETPEIREYLRRDWLYSPVSTYVLLSPGVNPDEIVRKINRLTERYADPRVKENVSYELQSLLKIHLFSNFTFEQGRSRIQYVLLISGVGLLVLLVACINFINLSTVHSLKRSREVGVRKVLGAQQGSLATQFLIESLLYVVIACGVGLVLFYLLLPIIREIGEKNLGIRMLLTPLAFGGILSVLLLTGLLSGPYPAFFIARFNPILALKGLKQSGAGTGPWLRRSLVVVQFTASIIMIVFSIVIFQQIKFMREKPLGFQSEFMLTIPIFSDNPNSILGGGVDGLLRSRMNAFENELLQHPFIEAVTVSSVLPGSGSVRALVKTDNVDAKDNVFIPVISVDYDFLTTYKIELLAGRNFSREAGTDHLQAFIANQQAIALLGWESPEQAIGQNIEVLDKKAVIVGVIKDYHFEGLQQPLRPLLLEVNVGKFTIFSIRVDGSRIGSSTSKVKEIWNSIFPERVFEYQFLDQHLKENYQREEKLGTLTNYLSFITILISCLGTFGQAAYINHQKQKQVSIRKVLGANTWQVLWNLSRELVSIVLLAVIAAFPIAHWVVDTWLENFAYAVIVGWTPFLIAISVTGALIFVTTVGQTLRTAHVNPVNALKED